MRSPPLERITTKSNLKLNVGGLLQNKSPPKNVKIVTPKRSARRNMSNKIQSST
jgi:hypothetical protein